MNPVWIEERWKRFTVSHLEYVFNKLLSIKYESIIKEILYNNLETVGMKYDTGNEKDALCMTKERYKAELGCLSGTSTAIPKF